MTRLYQLPFSNKAWTSVSVSWPHFIYELDWQHLASARSLFSPSHTCNNPDCTLSLKGQKLQTVTQHQRVLDTLQGPVPVYSAFLKCQGTINSYFWVVIDLKSNPQFWLEDCNTDYHLDYFVKGGVCFYYERIQDVLQISDHQFVEKTLINSWRVGMNLAWVSASNCAATYLHTHNIKEGSHLPETWLFQPKLNTKNIYDGFVLLALLEDHQRHSSILSVPHEGEQSDWFKIVMQDRNHRVRLYGQDERLHWCEKCVQGYPATDGQCKSCNSYLDLKAGNWADYWCL